MPALEILASPTGAGVSLSEVSALTKPPSRATAVSRPERWSICAAGLGVEEELADFEPPLELLLSLPHAAAPSASVAHVAMAAGVASLMCETPSSLLTGVHAGRSGSRMPRRRAWRARGPGLRVQP